MCEPVSITLGIMSAASGIMNAQAASDAQDEAYAENVRASTEAKRDADRQINLQESQAQEAAAQEQLKNDLQTQSLVSRAVVAGGESGALGQSTLAAQENIVRQGLEANTMVTQNLGRETAQMGEARIGAKSNYTSRINSVSQGAGVGLGTALGSIAGGVSTGVSTYASMSSIKANKAGGPPKAGGTPPAGGTS